MAEIDFDRLYVVVRSWDVAPSEFWGLTLREIIIEAEERRPSVPGEDYAGGLRQGDIDELEAMLRDDDNP